MINRHAHFSIAMAWSIKLGFGKQPFYEGQNGIEEPESQQSSVPKHSHETTEIPTIMSLIEATNEAVESTLDEADLIILTTKLSLPLPGLDEMSNNTISRMLLQWCQKRGATSLQECEEMILYAAQDPNVDQAFRKLSWSKDILLKSYKHWRKRQSLQEEEKIFRALLSPEQ